MKSVLIAAAAVGLLAALPAGAQTSVTTTTTTSSGGDTIVIAPEKRTVIKKYVTEHKVAPARVKEKITVGATVPQEVTLQPVPEAIISDVPSVKGYDYFVENDQVYFVEPKTRRVVTVIQE